MFEASILICSLITTAECMTLEDTRGPYETQQLCKNRVNEMVQDVWEIIPDNSSIKYRCVLPKLNEI